MYAQAFASESVIDDSYSLKMIISGILSFVKTVQGFNRYFAFLCDRVVFYQDILSSTGNSQFSPNGTFTRSQIAAIINRVARVLGVNTDGYTHSFTDVVGHWVDSELGWPSSVGIINGVGNNQFSPDTELTTEQAIAITYRALQILK